MSDRFAWGILGTGHIAGVFAEGVIGSDRGTLAAVGSRLEKTAKDFAAKYHIPKSHGTYEALLADPDVQAIYNSLPNALHHEWTIKALHAGKHVLCEKPLATNLAQAQEMFAEARRAKRVLVEAFMYRSHPMTRAIQKVVAEGGIGKLRLIRSSFIYATSNIAGNVRFSQPLAGGSLMDIGCYCISYSRLFAGAEPIAMQAHGHIHQTQVDDYAAGVMAFPGDIFAHFACGMTVCADNSAWLMGTDGYIEIPVPWKPPVKDAEFTIVDGKGNRFPTRLSAGKHLYALEADDFTATVLDKAPPAFSKQDSLGNQHCLDVLRQQIGVKF
jgi:predicted dehydrogenase